MRHLIITYLILAALITFSSCSNKQYQVLFEQKKTLSDSSLKKDRIADSLSDKNSPAYNLYRIKSQDILQVRNLQNSKYIVDDQPMVNGTSVGGSSGQGQTYQVDQDGNVALPVIGRVMVAGLTRAEAEKQIEQLYRAKLLKDPIIEVTITNLKVTLLGEVRAQGNFPLIKDRTTLIDLIGAAGGLTDKANEKNIKIIHGTEKNSKVTVIDLNDINSIYNPNAILRNGDIVYVSQNKRAVTNDNLQNFSLLVQPILIVFNTLLIIISFSRR